MKEIILLVKIYWVAFSSRNVEFLKFLMVEFLKFLMVNRTENLIFDNTSIAYHKHIPLDESIGNGQRSIDPIKL